MDSSAIFYILDNMKLQILLTLLLLMLIIKYIQWKHSRKHLYELAATVPHPSISKLPFLGHAHHLMGGSDRISQSLWKMFENKTPLTAWLGHRLFYLLSSPKDLEIVMNSPSCMDKDDIYIFAKKFIGSCLFIAPLSEWKINRKLLNPAFNQNILNNYVEIFSEQAVIFGDVMEKYDSYFDIREMCANFTLDILSETSLGIKLQAQTKDCSLARNIEMGTEILMTRIGNILYHSNFIFNLFPIAKVEQQICEESHSFAKKVIKKKQEEYKLKTKEKLLEAAINEDDRKKSFLDILIELQANGADINDQNILDETMLFLVAGSDTNAITLSFVSMMLGMFPQLQQKVYEEVIEVVGTDRLVEYTDLPKLIYTEKFIQETMRIFPPGPVILRKVVEDTDLGHCVLPKGAGTVLGIMACHRNPDNYPDPLKFDPERFNAEEVAKRNPYSYIPFSRGPRNCIGLKYAMMSVKTTVAMLVRRFHFETKFKRIEDIEIKQAMMIRSIKGYPIKVTKRNLQQTK